MELAWDSIDVVCVRLSIPSLPIGQDDDYLQGLDGKADMYYLIVEPGFQMDL